jgi:hypothetical protein
MAPLASTVYTEMAAAALPPPKLPVDGEAATAMLPVRYMESTIWAICATLSQSVVLVDLRQHSSIGGSACESIWHS